MSETTEGREEGTAPPPGDIAPPDTGESASPSSPESVIGKPKVTRPVRPQPKQMKQVRSSMEMVFTPAAAGEADVPLSGEAAVGDGAPVDDDGGDGVASNMVDAAGDRGEEMEEARKEGEGEGDGDREGGGGDDDEGMFDSGKKDTITLFDPAGKVLSLPKNNSESPTKDKPLVLHPDSNSETLHLFNYHS
jgi:hypothetical protein